MYNNVYGQCDYLTVAACTPRSRVMYKNKAQILPPPFRDTKEWGRGSPQSSFHVKLSNIRVLGFDYKIYVCVYIHAFRT